MTMIWHVPSPPLDTYIHDFYYIDGPAPYTRIKVLPMPVLHLMINLGDGFQIEDQAKIFVTCSDSWWVGLWNRSYVIHYPQNVRFYGIHFKPGGVYPFLQIPLSEITNQMVGLDAIWGRFAAEIRERLYDAPTVQEGFALLEQIFLKRLCEVPHSLDVAQFAVNTIATQHGALSIRDLSDTIGISQNHLGTHFKRLVGILPKELARFYRFGHVLQSLNPAAPVDWTRVALEACFYDQSHFNREFKAFTGHNPTDYLTLRRRFAAENPEQAQSLGQLPVEDG